MQRNSIRIKGYDVNMRHALLFSVITILLILNIGRWWPQSGVVESKNTSLSASVMDVEEIKLLSYLTPNNKDIAFKRNLFSLVVKRVKTQKRLARKVKETDGVPVRAERSPSSLSAFKLEGILDAEGKIQAFLSNRDEVYMVYKGEKFAAKIIAEKISHDGILLKDISNGMTKWITLNSE